MQSVCGEPCFVSVSEPVRLSIDSHRGHVHCKRMGKYCIFAGAPHILAIFLGKTGLVLRQPTITPSWRDA